jgi:hypothetical protein
MSVLRSTIFVSLLTVYVATQPASAATFSINGSTHAGSPTFPAQSGPTPVSGDQVFANERGVTSMGASARFGSVGAGSDAASLVPAITIDSSAAAAFADTITFTKTTVGASDTFSTSINLGFAGSLNAGAPSSSGAGATVIISVGFIDFSQLFVSYNALGDLTIQNFGSFIGAGTILGGAAFNTALTTQPVTVTVGQVLFSMQINTFASAGGPSASAHSDFSNTFKLPTGIDVFNLPSGYTANAGDWLVNNRFVEAPLAETPLPAALPLFASGLGVLGFVARRRKRKQSA